MGMTYGSAPPNSTLSISLSFNGGNLPKLADNHSVCVGSEGVSGLSSEEDSGEGEEEGEGEGEGEDVEVELGWE